MKRFFVGLLLLPFGIATYYQLPDFLFSLRTQHSPILWLALGTVSYAVFEVLFNRHIRTYVFGHELTHALAGLAVGSKIHSFKVSKKGGSVSLSKSNFFIALSPYCVPLYTFLVLGIYAAFKHFYPFSYLTEAAQFLVGSTLAFHLSLTIYAVQQKQPDIHKTGIIFSIVFILLLNAWVLVGLSKILFWNTVSVRNYAAQTVQTQNSIWIWVTQKVYDGGVLAYDWFRARKSL